MPKKISLLKKNSHLNTTFVDNDYTDEEVKLGYPLPYVTMVEMYHFIKDNRINFRCYNGKFMVEAANSLFLDEIYFQLSSRVNEKFITVEKEGNQIIVRESDYYKGVVSSVMNDEWEKLEIPF